MGPTCHLACHISSCGAHNRTHLPPGMQHHQSGVTCHSSRCEAHKWDPQATWHATSTSVGPICGTQVPLDMPRHQNRAHILYLRASWHAKSAYVGPACGTQTPPCIPYQLCWSPHMGTTCHVSTLGTISGAHHSHDSCNVSSVGPTRGSTPAISTKWVPHVGTATTSVALSIFLEPIRRSYAAASPQKILEMDNTTPYQLVVQHHQ